jgi:hypothetical protein
MCRCHELKDSIIEKTGSHADQEKCINVVIVSTLYDICNTVLNVNDIFNVKIKFLRKFLSIFHVVTTAKRHMRRRRNRMSSSARTDYWNETRIFCVLALNGNGKV